MNIENTKYKNLSPTDKMQNRLSQLEKMLNDIMASAGNRGKNAQMAKIRDNSFSSSQNENIQTNNSNSLILSDSQIAAQMAASMARANQRNS